MFGQLLNMHSKELEAVLTEEIVVAVQAERIVELERLAVDSSDRHQFARLLSCC